MNSSSVNKKLSEEVRNLYCNKGQGGNKIDFYGLHNRAFLLHSVDEPQHVI